jgi:two-component system, response regulator PdtaR
MSDHLAKKILIVEDEGLIAADIQGTLAGLGYLKPVIASSGEEALRCARSTPFDLVLMDIRLRGALDGISTAQAMKQELAVHVVYLTALSDEETLKRAQLTEPFGYIVKPVRAADLHTTVEISLARAERERLLIRSQRMDETQNLARELAIELAGQLERIRADSRELSRRLSGAAQRRAREIQQASSVSASIAGHLLALTGRQIAATELLNVDEVISRLQPLISLSLGKTRTLVTALSAPLSLVCVDRHQLKLLLLHLVFRVREAVPAGGELRLETASIEADAAAAEICPPGPYVRLHVAGTGHLTAVQLSALRSIVTQNHGYFNAGSETAKAMSFEILLPCCPAERKTT